MPGRKFPMELIVFVYVLLWIPNIALTRSLAVLAQGGFGRPLTGMELLPALTILTTLFIWLFVVISGWWRVAHTVGVLGLRIPVPTSWRLLAAGSAALIAVSTPLSYTFPGVSVPFVQLLMKGGVLIVAPLADILTRRKVHWYSWVALLLAGIGIAIAIAGRRGLELPVLCALVIGIYLFAYLLRLSAMSKAAKTDDPTMLRRYFVEEQTAAWPLAIVLGAVIISLGSGPAFDELRWGATHLWTSPALPVLMVIAALTCIMGVLSLLILLSPRENTFCVPLERSASVLGGVAAAYVLTALFGLPAPTMAELVGAAFLIAAMTVLSLGPRMSVARAERVSLTGGNR